MKRKKYAWKSLVQFPDSSVIRSAYDSSPWVIGKWRKVNPPHDNCIGLNCSKRIWEPYGYVQGNVLARVEYGGKVITSPDKLTCEKMRIVKAWQITPEFRREFHERWLVLHTKYHTEYAAIWAKYSHGSKKGDDLSHKAWLRYTQAKERLWKQLLTKDNRITRRRRPRMCTKVTGNKHPTRAYGYKVVRRVKYLSGPTKTESAY